MFQCGLSGVDVFFFAVGCDLIDTRECGSTLSNIWVSYLHFFRHFFFWISWFFFPFSPFLSSSRVCSSPVPITSTPYRNLRVLHTEGFLFTSEIGRLLSLAFLKSCSVFPSSPLSMSSGSGELVKLISSVISADPDTGRR